MVQLFNAYFGLQQYHHLIEGQVIFWNIDDEKAYRNMPFQDLLKNDFNLY